MERPAMNVGLPRPISSPFVSVGPPSIPKRERCGWYPGCRLVGRTGHTVHMDGDLVTPGGIEIPQSAMAWSFSRASGPGGQGVNTTDSRVELVVDLTALGTSDEVAALIRAKLGDSVRIVAATERTQRRNREAALRRLAERDDAAAR